MQQIPHRARKRFGQNFLQDQQVIARIVQCAHLQPDDFVIEIGAGRGALTRPLLEQLDTLHVLEIDRDLIAQLKSLPQTTAQLHVHQADVLQFEFADLIGDRPCRLLGNLPYNIATTLILRLIDGALPLRDMHFMLQREVALRLAATTGSPNYGRLSLWCQYLCKVELLFDVPPQAFEPRPKVDSTVVRLTPYDPPPVDIGDRAIFSQLLRCAFSHRRKMLRNNLKPLMTLEQMHTCCIDPKDRAQDLTLVDFARISRALSTANTRAENR